MVVLLIPKDSTNSKELRYVRQILVLPDSVGATVLGRDFFSINDKRVSRQQAKIEVAVQENEEIVTLTPVRLSSLHVSII